MNRSTRHAAPLVRLGRSAIAIAIIPFAAGCAWGEDGTGDPVDIRTTEGERIQGPLLEETPEAYVLRQTLVTRKGVMSSQRTVPKAEVKEIVHVLIEYGRRAAASGTDPASQATLARWCLDEQLRTEAEGRALDAVATDPGNADAGVVLAAVGYVDDHGKWLKRDAYLAAHGLAECDGKIMTSAQRDSLSALAAQRAADRKDADAKQQRADAIKAAIAKDTARIDAIAKEKPDLDKRVADDQAAVKTVDSAKRALDAAEARVKREENTPVRKPNGSVVPGAASNASVSALRKAKQDNDAAIEAGRQAQLDVTNAKQRQADEAGESAAAKKDLDAQQAAQKAAIADSAAAQAKAKESEQGYREAFDAISSPDDLPAQLKEPPKAPGTP